MNFTQEFQISELNRDREGFVEKFSNHIENGVITNYRIDGKNVVFRMIRNNATGSYLSYLHINNIDVFFFRRFETGMIRRGYRNFLRLHLNPNEKNVEHISSIMYWKHNLSGKEGVQLILYTGKMLRFLGDNLRIKIEDKEPIDNPYKTPDKVETPLTKLIYYSDKIIQRSKIIVDKIQEKAKNLTFDRFDDKTEKTEMQKIIEKEGEISEEFSEFTKKDEIELNEEQRRKVDEVLAEIERRRKLFENKDPKNYYEIFEFE